MNSTITAKYQTTIPKAIRNALDISMNDVLEWTIENGRAVICPVHADFLKYRGAIRVPEGDIEADVEAGRTAMVERHR